jgi:hypothetical protein
LAYRRNKAWRPARRNGADVMPLLADVVEKGLVLFGEQ